LYGQKNIHTAWGYTGDKFIVVRKSIGIYFPMQFNPNKTADIRGFV
jgi:hypothetical protein